MRKIILMGLAAIMIFAVGCNPTDRAEKKAERLKKLDKNQDGKIALEEWLTPHKKKFKRLDTDKDNYLSKDEMKATKKSGSGREFRKMDSNSDNQVTLEEWLSRGERKLLVYRAPVPSPWGLCTSFCQVHWAMAFSPTFASRAEVIHQPMPMDSARSIQCSASENPPSSPGSSMI